METPPVARRDRARLLRILRSYRNDRGRQAYEKAIAKECRFAAALEAMVSLGERRAGYQMRLRMFRHYKDELDLLEYFRLIRRYTPVYESALIEALAVLRALDLCLGGCKDRVCRRIANFRNHLLHTELARPVTVSSKVAHVDDTLLEIRYSREDSAPLENDVNEWVRCINRRMARSRQRSRALLDTAPDWVRRSLEGLPGRTELPTIQTHDELITSGKKMEGRQQEHIGYVVFRRPGYVEVCIPSKKRILGTEPEP